MGEVCGVCGAVDSLVVHGGYEEVQLSIAGVLFRKPVLCLNTVCTACNSETFGMEELTSSHQSILRMREDAAAFVAGLNFLG